MYKPSRETEILSFWKEKEIFKKSLEQTKDGEPYVFYDGPPFATGLPHVGHVLPSTVKDLIPRYQTMRGRYVTRRWGWDCHGLPIENLIEKELGLKSKKDILNLGIEKFNKAARESVLRYADQWRELVPRFGRWVDMDDDYRTMDASYTGSVWSGFAKLNEKGLVYEGFKVMYVCPRCETSLSNFEVNQGYKDITDISVYVKFALQISSSEASAESDKEVRNQDKVYLLAWTTTPWTLPGNMALAIGKEMEYVKVKVGEEYVILAKSRTEHVLKGQEYEIVEEIKVADLIGKSYEPVFDIYKNTELLGKENAWKVYAADFVTDADGSGVVHIAPGFGDDDLKMAQTNAIPFVQHIGMNGAMKEEMGAFAGLNVKPKDDKKDSHQTTDVEIIKYLAKEKALFSKEKIIHSYPHCWRCDTPLLNFATTSWFVKVTDIKDKLVEENAKIKWVPEAVGENRFGRWLEGARDWAVSRARFWGAPIPVWKSPDGKKVDFISSIDDLKSKIKRNNYIGMRHGESEHNVEGIINSSPDKVYHVTKSGLKHVEESAKTLKNIDVIYASPFIRTKETAELIKSTIGFEGEIIFDERLREFDTGDYDGHPRSEYLAYLDESALGKLIDFQFPHGESYRGIRDRVSDFLYDIDKRHEGKNILVVTHEGVIKMLQAVSLGGRKEDLETVWAQGTIDTGTAHEIPFASLPRNELNELDLHRPFIDSVVYQVTGEKGEKTEMRRVPDVFDCWFESGSMPFASKGFVFDKEKECPEYPAQFIAEGLDQTRGWFYSLIVLGTALFGKSPYQNVVVNGLILAEDGKKMSKSLNNYPPLAPTLEKYGVDSLRYFFLSTPSVKGEDTAFSEKSLDEVIKKHFNRLYNVISLYEMYKEEVKDLEVESNHVLDVWIKALLAKTGQTITSHLDRYEFDKATKPIGDFIEDLSVWYIRRSRDRFKGEDEADRNRALATTHYVLVEFSKLIAPFLPFLAEDIYQRMMGTISQKKESVHLEAWPEYVAEDGILQDGALPALDQMTEVRSIVSLALEARSKTNIKVRQPLARLMLRTDEKGIADNEALLALIKEEVNVKEVILDSEIAGDVMLDITLSPELIQEGEAREVMRFVQEMRKTAGLSPKDTIVLTIDTHQKGKETIERFRQDIMKTARIADFLFEEVTAGETLEIDGKIAFNFSLKKI
jgi:isoleucyl-tRNA synthetase